MKCGSKQPRLDVLVLIKGRGMKWILPTNFEIRMRMKC